MVNIGGRLRTLERRYGQAPASEPMTDDERHERLEGEFFRGRLSWDGHRVKIGDSAASSDRPRLTRLAGLLNTALERKAAGVQP